MSMSSEKAVGYDHKLNAIGVETSLNIRQFLIRKVITGKWSLSPLLVVKIIHLVDRTDLFKISNLVYGGREILTSLYSSLQGQRQFIVDIVS
jgi:hypothetical protein